jgi:RNA-directed DNA polymerase
MKNKELADKLSEERILVDLFQAYYDARKNKRNTINALAFEKNLESNLFELYEEIVSRRYLLRPSICFIVDKPVKREIFAADFRDRVVHHFLYNYIAPIFETIFITDCYSCREGKGTHYGVKRIDHFIRSCSENYSKDSFILKLDIKGYFMSINRTLLFEKTLQALNAKKHLIHFDLQLVLYLLEKVIFNDSRSNCIMKGKMSDWKGLPKTKSLFYARADCGLPIGNLTSQLFGNIYLNDFDHWVNETLNIKRYGRYVDDIVLIHSDKRYLSYCMKRIEDYLLVNTGLVMHPDKIYFQHFSKGVRFLGTVIKPHRIYVANRMKGNYYAAIQNQNLIFLKPNREREQQKALLSSLNSYLGMMKHYKTYHLRKQILFENLSHNCWSYIYLTGDITKFVLRKEKHTESSYVCLL